MAKFRKKPVGVSAWLVRSLLDAAEHSWTSLPGCIVAAYDKGDIVFGIHEILIMTLEGTMTGAGDDWVIQGVKGELYPCKPDIFAATYEAV